MGKGGAKHHRRRHDLARCLVQALEPGLIVQCGADKGGVSGVHHAEGRVEHQQVAQLRHVAHALAQAIGDRRRLFRGRGKVDQQGFDGAREPGDLGRDGLCGAQRDGFGKAFRAVVAIAQQAEEEAGQGQHGDRGAHAEQAVGGHCPGAGIGAARRGVAGGRARQGASLMQVQLSGRSHAPRYSPHRLVPSPGLAAVRRDGEPTGRLINGNECRLE